MGNLFAGYRLLGPKQFYLFGVSYLQRLGHMCMFELAYVLGGCHPPPCSGEEDRGSPGKSRLHLDFH